MNDWKITPAFYEIQSYSNFTKYNKKIKYTLLHNLIIMLSRFKHWEVTVIKAYMMKIETAW